LKHFVGAVKATVVPSAGNSQTNKNKLIMSTTKLKPTPNGTNGASAPAEPPTYRINPEVEAKIDAHIKDNPKYWDYLKAMPRERLERTVVLNEVRELDRQQRIREGVLKQINRNPELKQAYDLLVKNVPDDQKEDVIAQIGRTTRRAVARVQDQRQAKGEAVSV
jgi:hypothetical protein